MHTSYGFAQKCELGMLGKEAAYKRTFLPQHASALVLEHTLSAHEGCVNRIHWDETGSRLVSGSDDRELLVWEYPDVRRLPVALATRHRANIFGAHMLPQTDGHKIVSCSMDRTVQLHELPPGALAVPYGTGAHLSGGISQLRAVQPRTTTYMCHNGRVKDVEIEPMNPHNFWSASEDGTVRQFDSRCRTDQQSFSDSSNLLVHVRSPHNRETVELKGLDICQAHPHLLAVACSDPFVRVFDRRKLSLMSPDSVGHAGTQPLMQLAPAHLAFGSRATPAHTTYVHFSQKGDRLVATYHGDHAYMYDVTSAGCTSTVFPVPSSAQPHVAGDGSGWRAQGISTAAATGQDKPLPVSAAWERDAGDAAADQKQYMTAMEHYGRALHLAPWSAALWSHRASALMARGWKGDPLWALRDIDVSLALDPGLWEARLQRAHALKAMGHMQAALGAVEDAAACQAQGPRGRSRDAEAERQIAALRQQLEGWLQEQREDREREAERRRRIRDRRKDTMRGSMPSTSREGAGRPRAVPSTSQQQGGEEGVRMMSAVGGELVGREEEADRGREGEEEEEEAAAAAAEEEEEEEEEEGRRENQVFVAYYGFDANAPGVYVGPQPLADAAAAAQGHSGGDASSSAGRSRQGISAGRAQELLQGSMPGGPRLLQRFMGHINVQTDIKEACFLGGGDALVACGSDDGRVYIYDASTGMPLKFLQADQDVVNCVQGHPHLPVLATSGIEDVIRLWSPGETGAAGIANRLKLEEQVYHNQGRVADLPHGFAAAAYNSLMECPRFMELLMSGIPRMREGDAAESDGDEDEEGGPANTRCRVH